MEVEICLNHNDIISYTEESFFLVREVLQKHITVTEQRGHGFQKVQYGSEAEVMYAEHFWHFWVSMWMLVEVRLPSTSVTWNENKASCGKS